MTNATDTYLLLRAFVQELARCGMRGACTAPGSRSAPLALSLAREPRISCYSHVDERCAGFFALGLAKASRRPVALACTSGTAVAELLPAAVEAHEARVPLILLSADRPPELRENGAGQTIDQLKLMGGFAKWFFEVGVHEATDQRLRWMRTLACRAYWTAQEGRPGVVHLNFPLREPLVLDGALPDEQTARDAGRPYVVRPAKGSSDPAAMATLRELVQSSRRAVLIAGRHERGDSLAHDAAAFCATADWPLLADPLSGARRGPAAIAHYDALLRDERFASSMRPDLVIRVGDLPVSKPLRQWLAGLPHTRQVALDPEGAWHDPSSVLDDSLALDPAIALSQLAPTQSSTEPSWLGSWRRADEQAGGAIEQLLGASGLSEPQVAAELGRLPESATLFVASSMPVRDIETFWAPRDDPPRTLCNRGANGIDGIVSSAFGAAAAGEGPVVLLIGDVALTYDISALLAARRLGLALTIVLLNNGGGGIFDFLPVSSAAMAREPDDSPGSEGEDIYTRHIATPPGLDYSKAAELYGLTHERVADLAALRAALERALTASSPGSGIIEVVSDRGTNVELHRRIWAAVSQALEQLSPPAAGAAPPA